MKDAFGGILNLVLIALFLVIIEGVLAFIVCYTKAFRMKNVVISTIEQYDGAGCFKDEIAYDTACRDRIVEGAQRIGYSPTNLHCPTGYKSNVDLFCYKDSSSDSGKYTVYSVITQVDLNIPIINRIMGISIFQIHGDTRGIVKK